MVNRVVLPTPRWPNTPIRWGRHRRWHNKEAGRAGVVMAAILARASGLSFYCISRQPRRYCNFWGSWAIRPHRPTKTDTTQGGETMTRRLMWLGSLGGLLCLGWVVWSLLAKDPASALTDLIFATASGETLRLDMAISTQ